MSNLINLILEKNIRDENEEKLALDNGLKNLEDLLSIEIDSFEFRNRIIDSDNRSCFYDIRLKLSDLDYNNVGAQKVIERILSDTQQKQCIDIDGFKVIQAHVENEFFVVTLNIFDKMKELKEANL